MKFNSSERHQLWQLSNCDGFKVKYGEREGNRIRIQEKFDTKYFI